MYKDCLLALLRKPKEVKWHCCITQQCRSFLPTQSPIVTTDVPVLTTFFKLCWTWKVFIMRHDRNGTHNSEIHIFINLEQQHALYIQLRFCSSLLLAHLINKYTWFLFSLLSKNESRLVKSPVSLCVCVSLCPPLITFEMIEGFSRNLVTSTPHL
jgi:hypothetical protein